MFDPVKEMKSNQWSQHILPMKLESQFIFCADGRADHGRVVWLGNSSELYHMLGMGHPKYELIHENITSYLKCVSITTFPSTHISLSPLFPIQPMRVASDHIP